MPSRFTRLLCLALAFAATPALLHAQDDGSRRGRKYKPPLPTSHIEVLVLKGYNHEPIPNAAVIFRSVKDGRDEGNLEVKTNENGKAIIDVIPTGSSVDVQVIASGFATFANTYQVDGPDAAMTINMLAPRAQISNYIDTNGQPSDRPAGVQEPHHPSTPPVVQRPKPTNSTSDPAPRAPVAPNATPGNSQNPTPVNPQTPLQAPPTPPPTPPSGAGN